MGTTKGLPLASIGLGLIAALIALSVPPASAGLGDCGQVSSDGITTSASDALFILQGAVGSRACARPCLCDASGNGSTSSADALLVLRRAVGLDVRLTCACRTPQLEGLDPDAPLILPLAIQVAYNDDTFFIHSSWEGDRGDAHRYLRYVDGVWRREGGSRREAQATLDNDPLRGPTDLTSTIYESRLAFLLDDPAGLDAVPGFFEVGCFLTCHDHNEGMPGWDGDSGVSKHLPAGSAGKLDLFHHRLHRANPIGASDDQFVDATADGSGGRKRDAGTRPFTTQEQDEEGNPEYLVDPATSKGLYAFHFENVLSDPLRYLRRPDTPSNGDGLVAETIDYADAIEDGYVPRENDTVPLRVLREPTESAADITSLGTWFDASDDDPLQGTWHSNLQRLLDTGNPDDIAMAAGGVYNIGFAVHTGQVTVQDHHVSFVQTLALAAGEGTAASGEPDLVAVQIAGSGREQLPDWSDTETFPVTHLNLFKPGISSYEFLIGDNTGLTYIDPSNDLPVDQNHGGAFGLTDSGLGCRDCHTAAASDPFDPPNAGGFDAGSMEALAPLRGGIHFPTPLPPPN